MCEVLSTIEMVCKLMYMNRWLTGVGSVDLARRMEMYAQTAFNRLCLTILADFLLACCDVEGNFLVVKV